MVDGDDFDIVPLDEVVEKADFLKLDIEGYEPFALRGAAKLIERSKPVILIEQKPITARYGLDYLMAGVLLEGMNYELAAQLNKDYIYVPRSSTDAG